MAKRKLERFAENATFEHFFQPTWEELRDGFSLKGSWHKSFFKNDNPIIVELGCGKGEYTVDLGRRYPGKNYIGIDKKGARMWRGAKTSKEIVLPNVAFVRMRAESIAEVFAAAEIDEIWITFPEPQPNSPRTKKRFTSPQFIERYRKILKENGIIHLKTDNDLFYTYTLEVIKESNHKLLYSTDDLYNSPDDPEIKDVLPVQTHYEKIWLDKGLKIKYLRFQLV
ncbi:MAG: tRNA (guanosine(46)-N7)-methyltransferase TrmB [Bacteroidetes bacterium]|nr:tRNA (guanosine(46)-N7)-methyltransferase TrmB [Bacteroidota bacterium]